MQQCLAAFIIAIPLLAWALAGTPPTRRQFKPDNQATPEDSTYSQLHKLTQSNSNGPRVQDEMPAKPLFYQNQDLQTVTMILLAVYKAAKQEVTNFGTNNQSPDRKGGGCPIGTESSLMHVTRV